MPPLAPMYEVLALMLDALTDSIERDQREADKKQPSAKFWPFLKIGIK